jgi:hypothetical protein
MASMKSTPSIAELAAWLDEQFSASGAGGPSSEYEGGRQQMIESLKDHLGCSTEEAARLLDELERAGHLRYAAEARSVGGSAGTWIIYPSPGENPDVADDPSAP